MERKKKQFSHASMTTPTASSNQLKRNEIRRLCLDSDVLSAFIIVAGRQNGSQPKTSIPELLCPRLVPMRFLPEPYSSSELTGWLSCWPYWLPALYARAYPSRK